MPEKSVFVEQGKDGPELVIRTRDPHHIAVLRRGIGFVAAQDRNDPGIEEVIALGMREELAAATAEVLDQQPATVAGQE